MMVFSFQRMGHVDNIRRTVFGLSSFPKLDYCPKKYLTNQIDVSKIISESNGSSLFTRAVFPRILGAEYMISRLSLSVRYLPELIRRRLHVFPRSAGAMTIFGWLWLANIEVFLFQLLRNYGDMTSPRYQYS